MTHSTSTSGCLTDDQLVQIVENSGSQSGEMITHFEHCPDCQTRLDSILDTAEMQRYQPAAESPKFKISVLGRAPVEDPDSFEHFQIEERIGIGGMGVVYRAHDQKLGRTVALKVLTNVFNPTALARFDRETRAASRLSHPNIVPIHSSGRADDGRPFLVMPLVKGESLMQRLKREPIDSRDAAQLIHSIANGLDAIHQAELVHRDVKPANILIDQTDGQPKLVDFGLVRSADDATLTQTEMLCGTPEYMAPEQASSMQYADSRSDIYSLGITLYECLTGSVPFRGKPLDILAQHRELEPVPPGRMNKSVPRDLETVCLKAIEKEPACRYPTTADFASDLQRFLDGKPIQARPAGVLEKSWRWAKRNRPLAASLSLLFLALLTGTIVSTALWLQSEKNAALARNRNESLLASQKVLNDNQIKLWETLKNSYQKTSLGISDPYMNMPTAVRNTLLFEMAVTYRLLFERGQDDRDELRQMIEELAEVSEFTLERIMKNRSMELTELNREIVDRILSLQEQTSVEDLILATRVYNQFARARDHADDSMESETAFEEAILLAELAGGQLHDDAPGLSAERAKILILDSRRGLIKLVSKDNNSVAKDGLLAIVAEIDQAGKGASTMMDWWNLQQQIFLDLARITSGELALEYRNQRQDVLQEMVMSLESRKESDNWLQRKATVNTVMQGVALNNIGNHQEARQCWSDALNAFSQLTLESPTNSLYQADYFETMMLVADFDWNAGECEKAMPQYQRAVEQFEITVQLNLGDLALTRRAAEVRELVGSRYLELGQHKEAAKSFRTGAYHVQSITGFGFKSYWTFENDFVMLANLLTKAADAFDSAGMREQSEEARQNLSDAQIERTNQDEDAL